SHWKTYRSEEFGLEFQYPPTATVSIFDNSPNDDIRNVSGFNIQIGELSSKVIQVSPEKNSSNAQTLQELPIGKREEYRETQFGNVVGLKRISITSNGERIGEIAILLGDTYYYAIQTGSQYTPGFRYEDEQLFDAVVSTFQVSQGSSEVWQTYKNTELGFELKYPDKLKTEYIQLQTFNPESIEAAYQRGELTCAVKEVFVEGKKYCVAQTGDSGAGSTYSDYTYETVLYGIVIKISFVLRYIHCGNYGIETKAVDCRNEQTMFNPDVFANQIFSTFQFID
ncbi:MAG: hypothetical protein AAB524_02465, partial [Patescibacteria group bacterium]